MKKTMDPSFEAAEANMHKKNRDNKRVALVTGATSGHGRAAALALARSGMRVVLLGRDPERCRATRLEIAGETGGNWPDILICDLASRSSIAPAAQRFLDTGLPLHVLINNAGLVNLRRKETEDGVEMTFAVNYLAHYELTLRLLERMLESAPGRIINVSSDTHRLYSLRLDDLEHKRGYGLMAAYGRSKLALLYFTQELARRLAGTGVTVNAVDPGPVDSRIGMNNPGLAADLLKQIMRLFFPAADRAARTAVHLSTASEVGEVTGGYFRNLRQRRPTFWQSDPSIPAKLWETSARMTGVDLDLS